LKFKDNEQAWFILARSRFFVEKYKNCMNYCKEALKKYPDSQKIKDLLKKTEDEMKKE